MVLGRLTRWTTRIAPALLALAAIGGCSQPNPFTSRQTMVGSLKASVSQLEFDNEKLRKEMGELKAENTRLDAQLAQEREVNGEITARLDDAKDLIRRQDGTAQAIGAPMKNYEDDEIPPPVATPRSRPMKGGRKPPAARVPQPSSLTDPTPFGSSSDGLGYQPPVRPSRDLGDGDQDDRWLPVARGLGRQVQ